MKHLIPLAGLFLMSGCSSMVPTMQMGTPLEGGPIAGKPIEAAPKPGGLLASASSDKTTYKKGETASLIIVLKNTGTQKAPLNFSSGQSFDFQARKPGSNDPVWTWSMDKMFTTALRSQTLKPGDSLSFTGEWLDLPKGKYELRGWITSNPSINAAPFTITVE